jgi:hypothetical protein
MRGAHETIVRGIGRGFFRKTLAVKRGLFQCSVM